MVRDDRPFDALERLARAVNARRPAALLRGVRGAMERQVRDAGVKVLDDLVGRIAGHPVDTRPSASPEPGPLPTPPEGVEVAGVELSAAPAPVSAVSAPASADPASPGPESDEVRPSERPTRTDLPPERFGIDRVVLLFRGPDRALAYWETDPERWVGESPGELRLVDADGVATVLASQVALGRGRCYFAPPCDGRRWVAELWATGAEGPIRVSCSTPVEAPAISPG